MSIDRWIGIIGDVIGGTGVLLTLAVGRWPGRFLASETQKTLTAPDGAPPPVASRPPVAPDRPRGRPGYDFPRRTSKGSKATSHTQHEDDNSDIVIFLFVGGAVFVAAAAAAVGFVQIERSADIVAAIIAVIASAIALVVLIWEARQRVIRRTTLWLVALLFAVDAAVASLPSWFRHPWFGQGRFDNLPKYMDSSSHFESRVKEALKTYGDALIYDALAQALGLAILIIVAVAVPIMLVRRASGRSGGGGLSLGFGLLVFVLLGVVLASGSLVSMSMRIFSPNVWTAGKQART